MLSLRRELASSRAECAGLRAAADALQRDLHLTTAKCVELGAKNRAMQESGSAAAGAPASGQDSARDGSCAASSSAPAAVSAADEPEVELAEQMMRRQMERLVAEKARLAQDNARLARENTSLHELLSYQVRPTPSLRISIGLGHGLPRLGRSSMNATS